MTAARRLAAILAADVVGYSRLMGEDEAGAAKLVRERRDATAIVRAFGGRLVKTMGGVLLELPSVVAEVECRTVSSARLSPSWSIVRPSD
jgi:class 3 adenylate cyclase